MSVIYNCVVLFVRTTVLIHIHCINSRNRDKTEREAWSQQKTNRRRILNQQFDLQLLKQQQQQQHLRYIYIEFRPQIHDRYYTILSTIKAAKHILERFITGLGVNYTGMRGDKSSRTVLVLVQIKQFISLSVWSSNRVGSGCRRRRRFGVDRDGSICR